jgi:hypothetical protein
MNGLSPRPPSPAIVLAVGLFAVPSVGCVITDTPQFQTPQHTAPFLVGATAMPPLGQVQILDLDSEPALQFGADVISQDDPAGSGGQFTTVSARLYVDYGVEPPGTKNQPYFGLPFTGDNQLQNGTLDQTTGRFISATWISADVPPAEGCHTATLVASHLFDETPGCPRCDDDYSMLTWMVLACRTSLVGKPGNCQDLPVSGAPSGILSCPMPTTNCDAADPPARRMCPDATSAADAGTSADAGTP